MMKSLFLITLLVACAFSRTELEEKAQFTMFMQKFNKQYTEDEFSIRFQNFKDNLDKIDASNAKSKHAKFGVTQFSDLSAQEFRETILMKDPITPVFDESVGVLEPKNVDLPSSFDWRDHGAVTPVKNQAQCGSCWAFSVTENIESMWILAGKATNSTLSLAPQQIVDCDMSDGGCNGGNPPTAYDYVIQAGGLEPQADYPYTAENGQCQFNKADVQAKISSWKYATSWYSESTLQENLVSWGPLSICVDAASWQNYESGVMDWEDCAWVNILDHCVQLVGYNSDAPTPYWIVRNSWTTSWGIDGYIWLAMGGDTCGLTHEATTSVI